MAEETESQKQTRELGNDPMYTPGDEPVMAHVLFLDIVGYSKLSMKDQRRALQQLQRLVRSAQEFYRAESTERLLCLPTGDGMALVFFTPTPLAPVQCALELGRALRERPEIALRMGVHSGPVYPHLDIRVNRNVIGGGINIAQRVMDCGDAGHILLSKAVADVLNQIGGWAGSLHDLGEIKVKHGLPVHVYNLCKDGAGNPSLPEKFVVSRRPHARKRALLAVSVCLVLAALGFLSFSLWHAPQSTRPGPDRRAQAWDYQRTLVGHSGAVYSVAFSPDGRTVAGGGYDGTVILWDAQTGLSQRTLPMSSKSLVYMIAISPGGDLVAAGVGRDVLLADIKTEARPRPLEGHTGFAFAVAFSPDGRILASGSEDRTVRIWDVQTGETLHTLAGHTNEVNSVAFSADGRLLASGSYDGTIIIWDVANWTAQARLTGHSGYVYSVAFAPDGRTLASGGEDGTVRLWDVQAGTLKQTLYQHQGVVNSVVYAPDGETLASAGNDGLVLLWDARTGTVRQTLRRHTGGVTSLAFAPDGRKLASGSKDKTVVLWGLQAGGAGQPAAP